MRFCFLSVFIGGLTTLFLGCQQPPSTDLTANPCSENMQLTCDTPPLLHVPSPIWQDQIIYFLMVDRFADGDPSNNDQGVGVYDPSKESHYSGGDLKGITQHLDYIQQLGATALWTTPIVANQWWDPLSNYSGYHGYWARDFKAVDEHYGSLADYQQLSSALHQKGMYLIQDVVVNHTGNFFTYQGEYDPLDVTQNLVLNTESKPVSAPSQYPFNLNNANDSAHQQAAIYNWTPSIMDFSEPKQEKTYQTADLDDINTQNPLVQQVLKDSFGFWVKNAGVDAVRIDTAKYVEKAFYQDFLHGPDGLNAIAKQTGRDDFFSFGEIFQTSGPLQDNGEKILSEYISSEQMKRIDAPIGFPLYKEISRVFAGGAPTSYLSYRLKAQMRWFKQPHLVTNFIDNHDVERFLASGSLDGFKQAYAFMLTVPGIPTIYQGDEQAFVHSRRAMFAGGYLTDTDQFNPQAEMYQFINQLAAIRKANKVFSRGTIDIVKDNPAGAGVLVYKREYQGQLAYVIFNTAKQAVLLNQLNTEFDRQHAPKLLLSHNMDSDLTLNQDGTLTRVLPAQSLAIFVGPASSTQPPVVQSDLTLTVSIKKIQKQYINLTSALAEGEVTGLEVDTTATLLRVIDGKIADAKTFSSDDQGRWQVDLPVSDLGEHTHTLEIYWPDKNIASEPFVYQTRSDHIEYQASVPDPLGDDTGPSGQYLKPLDKTVGCQMDITSAEAKAGGSILELSIEMCDVSDVWAPPNGFDHVSFTIFFDWIDGQGLSTLPVIGGEFPQQQQWDLAHMVYGWANYLYSTQDASSESEGEKLGIAPKISVDKASKRIHFTYDGKDLGISNWADVAIYLTTWDKSGEGNYRDLADAPNNWTFGGASAQEPKILDDLYLTTQKRTKP